MTTETAPQKMEFKTELKQLLDLIIHSLYTKKEIFLRELISNAADAIDKLRFEALKDPQLLAGDSDFKIRLIADEKANTLTISDNGIGMSREAIVSNLGTIARSGTREFLRSLQQADAQERPELIGQFGVGFYSSYMVADRVTVISRPAGAGGDEAVKWESDGQGEFSVEPTEKPTRGTDVILHLREDAKEFLGEWRIRETIKRYSDFIAHPIILVGEKEKAETLNSREAIWLRPKNEVKPEEYNQFFKQLSRDSEDPLKTIHLAAEGATEFRALLFIPSHRGVDWMAGPEKKSSIDLYVRRVLITHECEELAPPYMRFVKGVVDSADLPLNVSRETLQHNPLLAKIRSNLVNRILKTLEETKSGEYETYLKFYKEFGQYLKEGVGQDWSNRERLADLLLLESTKTEAGKFTTLADYIGHMSSDQNEIFYLVGENRAMLENSPYVESFKAKGQEVLLLTDPVDEYLVASLGKYKDKNLKAVDRVDAAAESDTLKEQQKQFGKLLETLKGKLDQVKDIRLTDRLKESAACLVADEGAMGAHMERLLQRMGRGEEIPNSKRILELNPDHAAVQTLRTIAEKNGSDPRIEAFGRLLYDQAVIAEGSKIMDPAGFAKRVNELIAAQK
ncbi:MAG TPA: molecular chaperone HtpG [Humisphaera sp.]|nr:molecular chaperone HtpG [Humisphaera sp.]